MQHQDTSFRETLQAFLALSRKKTRQEDQLTPEEQEQLYEKSLSLVLATLQQLAPLIPDTTQGKELIHRVELCKTLQRVDDPLDVLEMLAYELAKTRWVQAQRHEGERDATGE